MSKSKALEIGDTFESSDCEGHTRIYTVQGFYPDGYPRTSGWDAPHSDNCLCNNPEEWY